MANDKKRYVIGYDLGGTKILAVLYNRRFEPLGEIKEKSKPQKGEKHFLKTLKMCFEDLLKQGKIKRHEIAGIGVGCPGLIDEKRGLVLASPNLGFMANMPLSARIQRSCGAPVVLGNDVNIGLFGEHQFGAAKGYRHVVGIFIGTGIGGALIINGDLYAGASGGAGELGHVQIDREGPRCGCGRQGCFEALCSRLSIASEAGALAARQIAPTLRDLAGTDILDIKSGQLAEAVRAGDRAIVELIRRKSRVVGRVMADLVNILNPEMIVLGGGLVEALPRFIVKEATQSMRSQAMPGLVKNVKVAPARLGDHAIVMGAAKRAWDRFGKN
jgi:glucokinase